MAGVEKANGANGDRGYYLSAGLVNKLIGTIFAAIITIAGYMIVWAVNDAAYRSEQKQKLELVESHIGPDHPDRRNNFQGQITTNTVSIAVINSKLTGIDNKLDRLLGEK